MGQIKIPRATTAQRTGITPDVGELIYDTTNGGVYKGDGSTLGGVSVGGSGDALTSNPLSQFASTTSSQLAGVISDEVGSGALVFNNSPNLITPILGSASATALTFSSTAVSGSTINKLTTAQRQALTPVIGDVVYDTTIGTTCTYTGTFWQYSKEYYVTSNVTTTTTLASTITGLTTFILEANSTYAISGAFLIQCNNNGGINFGNSLPVGASSRINYAGIGASATTTQQVASNTGTLTATGINRVNLSSYLTFGGAITTVATAGTVDMQFASSIGGQTSTVYGQFSIGYQSKICLTKIA
jgi:hypothetical protein